MASSHLLRIDGMVEQPLTLNFNDLVRSDPRDQLSDLKSLGLNRPGDAVRHRPHDGLIRKKTHAND